ncbi:MAG TPA: ATP-grasp domain-containing protein [Alphaproteobacteria bacterium]|nr:ATP-grasp domain-containing protein [Alphaproteobacteria bacterium]
MKSPRERRKAVLIVAQSARALAAAARRSRQPAIAIDAFRDLDTVELVEECIRVPFGPYGFDERILFAAIEECRTRVSGLVYGTGFEHSPALLARLEALVPLIGNTPQSVALVKDPISFANLLKEIGVPHPETTRQPRIGRNWLRKRVGGAGGGHIRETASESAFFDPSLYYQRRMPGSPVSALFIADGRRARILGFSEQWSDGGDDMPFRYGGSAGPIKLPGPIEASVRRICTALSAAACLRGLNSLDLLIEEGRVVVLEVNPRPGATLDIFDGNGGLALWRLHCRAIEGRIAAPSQRKAAEVKSVRAASIVYAPRRLRIPDAFEWPRWTSDRGRDGAIVNRNDPVCTVRASAATASAARGIVADRARKLSAALDRSRLHTQGNVRSLEKRSPWPNRTTP